MKLFLTTLMLSITGVYSHVSAQYTGGSTYRYNGGYNSTQNYYGSKGNTSVNTNRNYNYDGSYNSSTNVYKNGTLESSSNTYQDDWGNTTTIKHNYNTGRTKTTRKYKSWYE